MTWKCTNTPKGENKLYSDAKGVVPSLDLRFAEGKNLNDYMTGTPLVDHQRSMSGSNLSPGTFVNSSGLIETAKVNLLTYSEDLTQRALIDATAPTATLLQATAQSGAQTPYAANNTFTFPKQNTAYTVYADFEKVSIRYAIINFQLFSTNGLCVYDLDTGSVSNQPIGFTCSMSDLGGGIYRCRATLTTGIDVVGRVSFGMSELPTVHRVTDPTTADQIIIHRTQIEEGSTATTYIKTTNLPSAAPRFDHDPTTGESLGLLVEEQRANLLLRSQEFDNSYWTLFPVGDTTIVPDAVTAPDGTLTADKLVEGTSTGRHYIEKLLFPGASTTYTFSVYVKAAGRTQVVIYPNAQTAFTKYVTFNLSSGVVIVENGSNITGNIQRLANEWFRVSITTASGSNSQYSPIIGLTNNTGPTYTESAASYTGDGTSGIYIWGAQLEAGSFPTSYIPTTGTALTRSADVASITGSNFSSWYNQSEGTIFGDYGWTVTAKNIVATVAGTGANGNNGLLRSTGTTVSIPRIKQAIGLTNFSVGNTATPDNRISYLNGSLGGSLPNIFFPTYPPDLQIGSQQGSLVGYLNGYVSRLTYFPERLPDSSLQTMTTP